MIALWVLASQNIADTGGAGINLPTFRRGANNAANQQQAAGGIEATSIVTSSDWAAGLREGEGGSGKTTGPPPPAAAAASSAPLMATPVAQEVGGVDEDDPWASKRQSYKNVQKR